MSIHLGDHFTYKKLWRAVMPSILMMVFISIYGIVDGIFVSNFAGESAFVAVNLIWPITMIVGAVGFMFGSGGSALVSKTLGEGDPDKAQRQFTMVVLFTVIFGIVCSGVLFVALRPIAVLMGRGEASQETIDNAVLYGRILLGFEIMYMLQNLFQNFFVVAERSTLGLVVTLIAGCANMVLDALFVGLLKWGIVGAAVATGISQSVGAIIPLFYFARGNKSLLRFRKTGLSARVLFESMTNGSSELLSNIAMSVIGILFNMQLLKFAGERGVAAYGVIMYAGFIFCAVFIGYIIGVAPIISYHYGAQNRDELRSLFKKSMVITTIISVVAVGLIEALARPLASIFVSRDPLLLDMTTHGFMLYGISFAMCGYSIFTSGFFTALNDGLFSAIVSFSRTALFQALFVLLLPLIWGLDGIWLSVVFAEGAALALSIVCLLIRRRRYDFFPSFARKSRKAE